MKQKIEDTVIEFKDICYFKLTSPCAHHLWGVKYEVGFMDDVKNDFFHSLTP